MCILFPGDQADQEEVQGIRVEGTGEQEYKVQRRCMEIARQTLGTLKNARFLQEWEPEA